MFTRHPKIIIGYSDVTTLLNAIYARSGLVTFHGPVGISTFNPFTVEYFKRVLMDTTAPYELSRPPKSESDLTEIQNRVISIVPGQAEGILIGGNLTLMEALIGTPYQPDYSGAILFLEEIDEKTYSIDRMLTHLIQAGLIDQLNGFIFGKCTDCNPGGGYGAFSVEELLRQHLEPKRKPAFMGAMIGHIKDKWTVPIGVKAAIDSRTGSIRILESAVSE